MNLQIIFYTLGSLLLILGISLIFPFLVDYLAGHPNATAFGWSALFALFLGGGLCISNVNFSPTVTMRHAFILTTFSWVVISLFSSIPLYMSDVGLSFTDSVFESVSGITTTGATVMTDLDSKSRGIVLWRAVMQWIGGVGVIAFAMILLPYLRIGGMQLFRTESSTQAEKIMPKTIDIVGSIIQVYVLLTMICGLVYYVLGMGKFEALIHAMTTIPTGGFSSHDTSFGFYDSYALHMAGTFFMFLGGVPFILYVKYFYAGKFDFFKDAQMRTYALVLGATITVVTFYLWFNDYYSLVHSFKYAAFNIVSVVTTTGYASSDYTLWGNFAAAVFFFITYLGACAGSTSGGIKMLRLNIAFQTLNKHMKTLVYPNGKFISQYQSKSLSTEIIKAVMGFLFLYVFFNVLLTVGLTWAGLDFTTAISGAATAMANVGPGLGDVIGPAGNFAPLNDISKWMLIGGMLLGRLEVMTVLVLVTPFFWKH